jgi:predicted phage terminase large subunit-like protein
LLLTVKRRSLGQRWHYAVGVGSNGGDLVVIDDPHSEQTAMSNSGFDDAWEWYTGGPRQRLQPGGSIVLVQTRWSEKDMTGQLLRSMAKDPLADQWEVVELPAIFDNDEPCWPQYWSLEDLTAVKASIPPSKWNAQYQQNPTGEENAIIPREWWKKWEKEVVPQLQYVIQSYDTAFSKRETADYSAITTWGVFYPEEGGPPNLILLDSKKGRWDFPELKDQAYDQYNYWEPDTVIVEAKASGMPLTQELRQIGIPVVNYTPSKGADKVTRVHSVSPLFEAGMVWAPDEVFADEMIEEVAAFPNGEYDDLVDSMTQALMRYRQGNFIQLPSDDWEDTETGQRVHAYY